MSPGYTESREASLDPNNTPPSTPGFEALNDRSPLVTA
jgi:hypothetical protein